MSAWEGSTWQREQERSAEDRKAQAPAHKAGCNSFSCEVGCPNIAWLLDHGVTAKAPQPVPEEERPTWGAYFMGIAHAVSKRGTCDRKRVGAVIVRDNRILVTGYNGALPGLAHCDHPSIGHDLVQSEDATGALRPNCVRTVHAEANAIATAAREGIRLSGSRLYVNTYPCWPCFRLLVSAGVTSVVYDDEYRNDARVEAAALASRISLWKLPTTKT